MYKHVWCCRWCGNLYRPVKETARDGFCKSSCKQALYRAHKKYVTLQARAEPGLAGRAVTRKKQKICPLCNKPIIRVKDEKVHKLYIHKESVRGKGGRACIVPTRKTRASQSASQGRKRKK